MKNLIFIGIVTTSLCCMAQNNISNKNPNLLIRLSTNNNVINYYKSQENHKQASIESLKQKKNNQNIIEAFQKNYSLSEVYFFYSDQSKNIINKKLDSLFSYDGLPLSKQKIETIKKEGYLIGYFGLTKSNLKFHALILNDNKLNPLQRPNIRFIRTYRSMGPFKRKEKKVISILEKKIKFKNLRK